MQTSDSLLQDDSNINRVTVGYDQIGLRDKNTVEAKRGIYWDTVQATAPPQN